MQGPYTISEPVDAKREFAFFIVAVADNEPLIDQGGGQPQIRKPGSTTWTDTNAELIHIGNGHYIIILAVSEINIVGMFSIRYRDVGATAVEFEDVGKVSASGDEVSLDEVNAKIDKNRAILKEVLWNVNKVEKRTRPDDFINPL